MRARSILWKNCCLLGSMATDAFNFWKAGKFCIITWFAWAIRSFWSEIRLNIAMNFSFWQLKASSFVFWPWCTSIKSSMTLMLARYSTDSLMMSLFLFWPSSILSRAYLRATDGCCVAIWLALSETGIIDMSSYLVFVKISNSFFWSLNLYILLVSWAPAWSTLVLYMLMFCL